MNESAIVSAAAKFRRECTCEIHGSSPYCLVCCHLCTSSGLSYYAIASLPDHPAQAWCSACDAVLEAERGWSDRADEEADWKLVCSYCFAGFLGKHTLAEWIGESRA